MKRRNLKEINAGSMADIAFLLLIFFLVATTMSTNTGMQRKLPPIEKVLITKPIPVRNVLLVLINKDNVIAVNGEPILLEDLCEITKEFFLNSEDSENLPEKKNKNIPFLGEYFVSKGVVSLQTDRNTNYNKYIEVQNELVRAINELRNELAVTEFSIPFEDLSDEKQEAIGKAYPLAISEAEPRIMTTASN